MRIWIDLTATAHPVVFRPLLARLRDEHVARREDHPRALWGLLCFVPWQQAGAR